MTNAYPAFSYTHDVDEDGDPVDELHIDEAFFQGKKIILFDDIIASGNSVASLPTSWKDMVPRLNWR